MNENEIEKKLCEAFEVRISALETEKILKKAMCKPCAAAPEKRLKKFLFSTKRGVAALAASLFLVVALSAGIPLGILFSGGPVGEGRLIVEGMRIVNGNFLVGDYKKGNKIQLEVKIKYKDMEERDATSEDVKYIADDLNIAEIDINGLITVINPGSVNITVESVRENADAKKLYKSAGYASVSGIPATASLNTKTILPNMSAWRGATVDVSVKFTGNNDGYMREDVKDVYIDERTGYATGEKSEKAEFDNNAEMFFYPTKTGNYLIEYNAVDAYGNKSVPHQWLLICDDRTAPKLMGFNSEMPFEWGLEVFGKQGEKISNIIKFPYPEYIDNSGKVPRISFEIRDMTNNQTVLKINDIYSDNYYDKEYQYNEYNYMSTGCYTKHAVFTKDGIELDFSNYINNPHLNISGVGNYQIVYKASDERPNITVKTFDFALKARHYI